MSLNCLPAIALQEDEADDFPIAHTKSMRPWLLRGSTHFYVSLKRGAVKDAPSSAVSVSDARQPVNEGYMNYSP